MERTSSGRSEVFEPNAATRAALRLQELYGLKESDGEAIEQEARTVFELTYAQLYGSLLAELYGDEASAQDVLQMSYERAFKAFRRGKFRGESQVDTWLHTIASNSAKNHKKKTGTQKQREVSFDLVEHDMPEPESMEERVLGGIDMARYEPLFKGIPDENRLIWWLHHMERREYAEVVAILASSGLIITIGAAKLRAHRTNNQLKENINK